MKSKQISKQGFSLIEVIVAVAILAVLSMPILLYFTNSALHSAHGKHEQAADMAAQTVSEEIDSITDFGHIEDSLVGTGRGWSVMTTGSVSGITNLHKAVVVDSSDYNYVADVTINYGSYFSSGSSVHTSGGAVFTSASPKADYNAYANPEFHELYSDESVIISEKSGDFDIALGNLYYEFNGSGTTFSSGEMVGLVGGSFTTGAIMNEMKRTLVLSVKNYSADTYMVKGSCIYSATLGAVTKSTEVPVNSKRVEKSKLKNIYFMFFPNCGTGEKIGNIINQSVILDFQDMIETDGVNRANDLSVSFIKQNVYNETGIADDSTEVVLDVIEALSSNYTWSQYYKSDKVSIPDLSTGGLMRTNQDKRIAYIKVDIYADDGTGNPTGGILATSTTTKSI